MLENLSLNWDMDTWSRGGSNSEDFRQFLDRLEFDVESLGTKLLRLCDSVEADTWSTVLEEIQEVANRVRHASNCVECLTAQDTSDNRARALENSVMSIEAAYKSALGKLDNLILRVPQDAWNNMLEHKGLKTISFFLKNRRHTAQGLLPNAEESLANALAVDGHHAWGRLHRSISSNIKIAVEQEGKIVELTAGQAYEKMLESNRNTRAAVFYGLVDAWDDASELCAVVLNHLAGFRLTLYRQRGWVDVLREPLDNNRISRQTLEAMWQAVAHNRGHLSRYLERKRKLLGLSNLRWYDINAPIGKSKTTVSYDAAANFIVKQVKSFSPRLAVVVERAFREEWIDAEERPRKSGGFCTPSPITRQSRICLTYHNTVAGCSHLAHELGHAYHQYVMHELPAFIQRFPMTLAEAASTFTEIYVFNAALKQASSEEEKVALLDSKLQTTVLLLMNMYARFLFEKQFYEMRKTGIVDVSALNSLMIDAQREAYGDALSEYYPYQWASTVHFYLTDVPFYNFPYTFGYLFSIGILATAEDLGDEFEDAYINLLSDSGRMTVEDLAERHLGANLAETAFWEDALSVINEDIEDFMKLTENMK